MGRPRSGIAVEQNGVVYTGLRLRSGARRLWRIADLAPAPAGMPSLAWAKLFSLQMQARYDANDLEPEELDALATRRAPASKPAATAVPPRSSAAAPADAQGPTVTELAVEWVKTLPKAQALDDGRRLAQYLGRSTLGARVARTVTPEHIHAFVAWLTVEPARGKGTLAPRTVRNAHDAVRRMFAWASRRNGGTLRENPCAVAPDNLPDIFDKDPEFRSGAVFTRAEALQLVTDARIPEDRRTVYATLLLTGVRFGELAALRWRHYAADVRPLGRLLVALSVERNTHEVKRTKTGTTREVPVHPALARVLAAWREGGFARLVGRAPLPEDLLLPPAPTSSDVHRRVRQAHKDLQIDLDTLGLRERRVHDARRTFVSLCRDDGARGDVLKHVTHGVSRSAMMDVYSSLTWETYCTEVSRLRFDPEGGFVTGFVTDSDPPAAEKEESPASSAAYEALRRRGGRDLNPTAINASQDSAWLEAPHPTPDGVSSQVSSQPVTVPAALVGHLAQSEASALAMLQWLDAAGQAGGEA